MPAVNDPDDAERIAIRWLKTRYGRSFYTYDLNSVWRDEESWVIKGYVTYKSGIFSTEDEDFRLQIDRKSGEIAGYDFG